MAPVQKWTKIKMQQPFLHAVLLHKLTRSESRDNELVALLCLEKQPGTVLESRAHRSRKEQTEA